MSSVRETVFGVPNGLTEKVECASQPDIPFPFKGYIHPCAKYLYFSAQSDTDPYSGVSFRDVANNLGVCMVRTSDRQPLVITQEGRRLVDRIGPGNFSDVMGMVNSLILLLTDEMYPPYLVKNIIDNDKLHAMEYKTLVSRLIGMAQGSSPDKYMFTGRSSKNDSTISITGTGEFGQCNVHYLSMGAQHSVYRVAINTDSSRSEFVAKTPSMHAILGFRGRKAVGRIHPMISHLLRNEALRQHFEALPKELSPVHCSRALLATPHLYLEEYYGKKTHPSDAEPEIWDALYAFDIQARDYLNLRKKSPDDPISRIMSGVIRPDIYSRRVGPRIEADPRLTIPSGHVYGSTHDVFLAHNIAVKDNDLVCYDPFVLHPLDRPADVPINPRAPWRKGAKGGRFNSAEFERYFPSPNNPPLLK